MSGWLGKLTKLTRQGPALDFFVIIEQDIDQRKNVPWISRMGFYELFAFLDRHIKVVFLKVNALFLSGQLLHDSIKFFCFI